MLSSVKQRLSSELLYRGPFAFLNIIDLTYFILHKDLTDHARVRTIVISNKFPGNAQMFTYFTGQNGIYLLEKGENTITTPAVSVVLRNAGGKEDSNVDFSSRLPK